MPATALANISATVANNLCVGCGLCSVVCPKTAIGMIWLPDLTWKPLVNKIDCCNCGHCLQVCPHSPQCIVDYAVAAQSKGARFGLAPQAKCFIAYDKNPSKRIGSASGGATSALLEHLLVSQTVDGVVAVLPLSAPAGQPHFETKIIRSVEDLERARSSHYYPVSYHKVLGDIRRSPGSFAVVGVPCVLRGLCRLPAELQGKIKFKFSLVCSHNVTGAFSDCLASKEGIEKDVKWQINLRDKVGILDANTFNNLFVLPDREIRRNRFVTTFTEMWRNYFFAQECCLYCADFYGVDADISIKDAWGRLSRDPLGTSLVIVNNGEIEEHLERLKSTDRIFLQKCDADEIFNSQTSTPIFKHEKVRHRLVWKNCIKQELEKRPSLGWSQCRHSPDSREYWRLWLLMKLSNLFYFRFTNVPVKSLLLLVSPLAWNKVVLKKSFRSNMRRYKQRWKTMILSKLVRRGVRSTLLFWGVRPPKRSPNNSNHLRVLVAGGYGYGNVGDEAQLAANLQHWQRLSPSCRLTILTPNKEYTNHMHGPILVELAPRKALFGRGSREYFGSVRLFKLLYPLVAGVCLFNARLVRAGLPVFGLTSTQVRLLNELNDSDVLFLSGGGYLTGMTMTRLWDNMLLISLASALGVPTILSGQTIGVFKNYINRGLAYWGLKKAELIYLRDPIDSPKDLASIGLSGEWIKSTFDDALFFQGAPREQIDELLQKSGLDPQKPFFVVNVHYWGQTPEASRVIMANIARALDRICRETKLQLALVPMVRTDEAAIKEVMDAMDMPAIMPDHAYRPDLAVGLIQNAALCVTMKHHPIIFAMAAAVPTVSMTFDDYYYHKNFGAMKIFNQEDYLLHCPPLELERQLFQTVINALDNREKVVTSIAKVVEELRSFSGEVIKKFLLIRTRGDC